MHQIFAERTLQVVYDLINASSREWLKDTFNNSNGRICPIYQLTPLVKSVSAKLAGLVV
jgi:hypothetical protein